MPRQQGVLSSKYCTCVLYAVESKSLNRWLFVQSIACRLEENKRNGKG